VVTVEARGARPDTWREVSAALGREAAAPRAAVRPGRVRVRYGERWLEAPVWPGAGLAAGFRGRGPMIVLEDGATLWVAPGWAVGLERGGTLVLERG